jgi:hypothetical protein
MDPAEALVDVREDQTLGYHPGMPDDTPLHCSLLTTALVGALLPADVPEGRMMRAWLILEQARVLAGAA